MLIKNIINFIIIIFAIKIRIDICICLNEYKFKEKGELDWIYDEADKEII